MSVTPMPFEPPPATKPRYAALLSEALTLFDASEIVVCGSGMLAERQLCDVNDLDLLVPKEAEDRVKAAMTAAGRLLEQETGYSLIAISSLSVPESKIEFGADLTVGDLVLTPDQVRKAAWTSWIRIGTKIISYKFIHEAHWAAIKATDGGWKAMTHLAMFAAWQGARRVSHPVAPLSLESMKTTIEGVEMACLAVPPDEGPAMPRLLWRIGTDANPETPTGPAPVLMSFEEGLDAAGFARAAERAKEPAVFAAALKRRSDP